MSSRLLQFTGKFVGGSWRGGAKSRRKHRSRPFAEGGEKGPAMSYSDTRISKGSAPRCSAPPRTRSSRGEGGRRTDDSPPRELAEHEEAGQRRTVAANRRRPCPPINPRVCAPQPAVPYVGSLRRPRFGYRAQGRRPITSLATAVGVTSSPSLSTLALSNSPIPSTLRITARNRRLRTSTRTRFPFPASSFNPSSFETFHFNRSLTSHVLPSLHLFILHSGFAKIEPNLGDRPLRVAVKDVSRSFRDVQAVLIGLTFLAGLSGKNKLPFLCSILSSPRAVAVSRFKQKNPCYYFRHYPNRAVYRRVLSLKIPAVFLAIFGKYSRGSVCGCPFFFFFFLRSSLFANRLLVVRGRTEETYSRSKSTPDFTPLR